MHVHDGSQKLILSKAPMDPDAVDEFFFVLGGAWENGSEVPGYSSWLRTDETVATATFIVTGGAASSESVYATRTDHLTGYELRNVYGVVVSPSILTGMMEITLRVTTTIAVPDNARLNIDHTIRVPIRSL